MPFKLNVGSLTHCRNYTYGGTGFVVQIEESLVFQSTSITLAENVEQQSVFGLYDTATKQGHYNHLIDDRHTQTLISPQLFNNLSRRRDGPGLPTNFGYIT